MREDTLHLDSETLKHLADVLSGTNTRLLVVGGAGSLYLDDTLSNHLFESDDFEGEKTGKYILAGEVSTVNSKGDSYISYADYAKTMVDEAVNGKNIGKCISVLGE